jgi:hypothetical protein
VVDRFALPHRKHVRWTGRSAVSSWRIRNVHERLFEDVPGSRIAPLLAGLGSAEDVLWPGADWSPMVLDRPLSEGACGGHGNVRYTCTTYVPGKLVEFTFNSVHGRAVDGRHVFEAIPRQAGTLFRHTLDLESDFGTWLTLSTVVVPGHDAVLEQLLDNLEQAATGSIQRPYRWPNRVRLIRRRFGLPTQMSRG